jgi:hypothetical protein
MRGPGAALVSTKWAALYMGRKSDVAIRTQLRKQNLSFGSERTKAQLPDGQLSWWEMVRLDAYRYLSFGDYRANAQLRDGLLLLQFPLRPFVLARAGGSLPVLLKPDQLFSYQLERGFTGAYDPDPLLRAIGLRWAVQGGPSVQQARPVKQEKLFGEASQLDMFDVDGP